MRADKIANDGFSLADAIPLMQEYISTLTRNKQSIYASHQELAGAEIMAFFRWVADRRKNG